MTAPAQKELICISCPVGCQLSATVKDGELAAVRGNKCRKGISYARDEVLDPRRILTTTIRVRDGKLPQLPVRTREAIPKDLLAKGMEVLSQHEVDAPIRINDVLVADFMGTGTDLIASRGVDSTQ